jgi:hypothetical protein
MVSMLTESDRALSRSQRLMSKPVLGLFALALLLLCLDWVLPHPHGFLDDQSCGLCLVTGTPSEIAQVPIDGAAIECDLPHERPAVWDSTVPEGPALLALRPRGPPLA